MLKLFKIFSVFTELFSMEIRELTLQSSTFEPTALNANEAQEAASIYDEIRNDDKDVTLKSDIEELNAATIEEDAQNLVDKVLDCFKNFFSKKQPETKDGVIDYTRQSQNGDCWLLSGVNALSYSKKGQEIIKNSLEYQEDSAIVHLQGAGDYTITNEELKAAKKDGRYAKGDDDMVIMELAISKVLDRIQDKEISFDLYSFSTIANSNQGELSTYGGHIENALYLITGKESEKISDKDEMSKVLDELEDNYSNMAIGASIGLREADTVEVETINGNKVDLSSRHAYSIKSVSSDTISVVNPWDSSQTIELDKKTFIETFDNLTICDLSENNPQTSLMIYPKVNEDGSKTFTYDISDRVFNTTDGGEISFDEIAKTYSKADVLIEQAYIIDGKKDTSYIYDENTGEKIEAIKYYNDGTLALGMLTNQKDTQRVYRFSDNGELLETIEGNRADTDELLKKAYNSKEEYTLEELMKN